MVSQRNIVCSLGEVLLRKYGCFACRRGACRTRLVAVADSVVGTSLASAVCRFGDRVLRDKDAVQCRADGRDGSVSPLRAVSRRRLGAVSICLSTLFLNKNCLNWQNGRHCFVREGDKRSCERRWAKRALFQLDLWLRLVPVH